MALIKCPECNHDVSDKAPNCPKCGYEINVKNEIKTKNNKKFDYRTIIIIIILGIGIWYFTSNKTTIEDPNNKPTTTGEVKSYSSSLLGLSFEYPTNYKVKEQDDNLIYVYSTDQNGNPAIPYVAIGRYDDYSNTLTFINAFTNYIKQSYINNNLSIGNMKTGNIDGKDIIAISYTYTIDDVNISDYRYAMLINNKVYMVFSKTYRDNSEVMNDLATTIIKTLNEVNK